MDHTEYAKGEIGERGEAIYSQRLRSIVETEQNIGKIISIDINSEDYEIDADLLTSGLRLRERKPEAIMYGKRIGYNAVYSLGGSLYRTDK